jgi:hypothetical protein
MNNRIPCILGPDESSRESRKNWARLIQKIYEVDPLTCPKCSGKMKVISVIEDQDVIKKILKHLGLWQVKPRPPPRATKPPKTQEYKIDDSISQFPPTARKRNRLFSYAGYIEIMNRGTELPGR